MYPLEGPVHGFKAPHALKWLLSLTTGSHPIKIVQRSPTPPLSGKIQAPTVMHSRLPIVCFLPLFSASAVAVCMLISPSCFAAISSKVPCLDYTCQPWNYPVLTQRLPFERWAWSIRSFLGSLGLRQGKTELLAEGCGPLESCQHESRV